MTTLPVYSDRINAVLDEIGVNNDKRALVFEKLTHEINECAKRALLDVEDERDELCRKCTIQRDRALAMQKDLPDVNTELRVETVEPPYEPLLQRQQRDMAELQRLYTQRAERKQAAQKELETISERLGQETAKRAASDDMSLSTICELESQVSKLRRELQVRLVEKQSVERSVNALANILGIDPPDFGDSVSPDALEAVRMEVRKLEALKAERETSRSLLRQRVSALWKLLEIPLAEQKAFEQAHGSLATSDDQAWTTELTNLENVKHERLNQLIETTSIQLAHRQEQMLLSSEERTIPKLDNAEATLEAIQREIAKLDALLTDPERQRVLNAVKLYLEVSNDEHQVKGNGPAAQQAAKRLARRRPIAMNRLRNLLPMWTSRHGPLLVYGRDLMDELGLRKSKSCKQLEKAPPSTKNASAQSHSVSSQKFSAMIAAPKPFNREHDFRDNLRENVAGASKALTAAKTSVAPKKFTLSVPAPDQQIPSVSSCTKNIVSRAGVSKQRIRRPLQVSNRTLPQRTSQKPPKHFVANFAKNSAKSPNCSPLRIPDISSEFETLQDTPEPKKFTLGPSPHVKRTSLEHSANPEKCEPSKISPSSPFDIKKHCF